MSFIPTPHIVTVTREGGAETGQFDDHGNPVLSPPRVFDVSVAGWAAPGDEAVRDMQSALGVDLALELYPVAGLIALGDVVTVDGADYTVARRKNFDSGPFGFVPGLDVLYLVARKG